MQHDSFALLFHAMGEYLYVTGNHVVMIICHPDQRLLIALQADVSQYCAGAAVAMAGRRARWWQQVLPPFLLLLP